MDTAFYPCTAWEEASSVNQGRACLLAPSGNGSGDLSDQKAHARRTGR